MLMKQSHSSSDHKLNNQSFSENNQIDDDTHLSNSLGSSSPKAEGEKLAPVRVYKISKSGSHHGSGSSAILKQKTVSRVKTPEPTDPHEVLHIGMTLLQSGDLLRASTKLEYVVGMSPTWLKPKITLIEIYSELSDWASCAVTAKSIVSHHPNLESGYCALTWSLRKLRRFDEAIDVATQGIELFPESVKLYSIRGESHYDAGNYKQATGDFHKVIVLDRRNRMAVGGPENALKPWARHPWRLR